MVRIYVSSTYGDLKEQREQVYRTLHQLDHDVVAMEDYVAADQRPLERCLGDVARCDLYVGIFAQRYGYIPQEQDNPEQRSITELEYRHAQANGKPCLSARSGRPLAIGPGGCGHWRQRGWEPNPGAARRARP